MKTSVKKVKAIVLHVGTNNVTEADQQHPIDEDMKDLADTISNINRDTDIIVSSILPRRNDKLVNQAIMSTNHTLKEVCEEKDHHFLDNNPKFTINGIPDSSLYRDSVHFNPKEGKVLGTKIRQKLNSVLNLSENNTESESVPRGSHQADFHNGRQQGWRQFRKRGMMNMPMPLVHESVPAPKQQQPNESWLQQAGTATITTEDLPEDIEPNIKDSIYSD